MDERRVRTLRFVALQLVGAVAVVHIVVGVDTLLDVLARGLLEEYLTTYLPAHPRSALFVVSGVAILGGVVAVARGHLDYRTGYLLGVAMMATYVVGWVAWHTVLDHGLALDAAAPPETGHTHGGLLATLRSHYVDPLVAVVVRSGSGQPGSGRVLLGVAATTLELAAIAVLAVLLAVDPRASGASGDGVGGAERSEDDTVERGG